MPATPMSLFDPSATTVFAHGTFGLLAQVESAPVTGTTSPGEPGNGLVPGEAGETGPAAAPGWYVFLANPLIPLILLLVVFYAFIIGGNRKKERARRDMIDSMTKGDKVTTIGGMMGTVLDADADTVTLKVDENNNTKIRFTRAAVSTVHRDAKK